MSVIPQLYNQGTGLIGPTTEGNNLPDTVDDLIVNGSLLVLGGATFESPVVVNSDLEVAGNETVGGNLIVTGAIINPGVPRKLQTLIEPYTVVSNDQVAQTLLGSGSQVIGSNVLPANSLAVGDTFTAKSTGAQENLNNGIALFDVVFGDATTTFEQTSIDTTLGIPETGYSLGLSFTVQSIGTGGSVAVTLSYLVADNSTANEIQGRVFSEVLPLDTTAGGAIELGVREDIGTGNPVTFSVNEGVIRKI